MTTFPYPTPDTYSIVDSVTRIYTGDATKNAVTSFAHKSGATIVTDANGHTTTDDNAADNERVTAVHLPTGATTSYTYGSTFTVYPASVTDAQNRTVTYTDDAKGNRGSIGETDNIVRLGPHRQ